MAHRGDTTHRSDRARRGDTSTVAQLHPTLQAAEPSPGTVSPAVSAGEACSLLGLQIFQPREEPSAHSGLGQPSSKLAATLRVPIHQERASRAPPACP